jgi:DNA-directed RNA polymerase subunit RPC12/RpoP
MADFVTLTCPTCGAKLEVTADIDRFACANCGNEHLIKRAGGIIALTPLVESLRGVEKARDRHTSELAITRLQGEIAEETKALGELKDVQADLSGCLAVVISGVAIGILCRVLASIYLDVRGTLLNILAFAPVLLLVGYIIVSLRDDKRKHRQYLQAREDLTRRIAERQAELDRHRENLRR